MTASSPYAPRRSSSFSSSSPALRRSNSLEAAVNSGAAATIFWIFLGFWRRAISENAGSGGGMFRALFDGLAQTVDANLTVCSNNDYRNNSDGSIRRRDLSTVLRWVVGILGGDQSRLGKIAMVMIGFLREVLLRSIGATSVILTGVPTVTSLQSHDHKRRISRSMMSYDSPQVISEDVAVNALSREGIITNQSTDIEIIRRDRQQIDQVLNYWFGQASPDGAQKILWMIASSSVELLEQVDADIAHKFRELIWDLSSNENNNEEGMHLDKGKMHRWTQDVEIFGWQGKIAAIIALDQMSRHIHRYDKGTRTRTAHFIPEQCLLDDIAYQISRQLQMHHEKELSTGIIPLPMRIFAIMPLRHAANISDYSIVQHDVESCALLHEEMDRMIRRFRKATNRRMAALQDEARREGKLGLKEDEEEDCVDEKKQGCEAGKGHKQFEDDQILECFPFQADMTKANDHAIVKTIRIFLKNLKILDTMDKSKSTVSRGKASSVIVSLSGGVDSMVIAAALAFIRDDEAAKRNVEPNEVLNIIAIHIDYANRPESGAEAAYVGKYARQLGAKFICRKIDEVTRGVTARDDYERIAREIRFDLYRQCCREASDGTEENGIGVMLGHHRGDLRENVISNAHKGCGPLDLSGMTSVSTNDGVNIFRPLLPLEKSFVYDYAHTYGVPYFKDTTPHWSTRGKLRNRLIPLLEEIYGEGSMNNLSSLAEESDDARKLIEETVLRPFLQQVDHYPMGIAFETAQWKDHGLFFWKFVLRQILHSIGRGMFSDKSTETFLERIRSPKIKEGWLQCRKDYAVYLQKNGRVLVLQPTCFPFHKRDHYAKIMQPVQYGLHNKIRIGPWNVSAEIMTKATEKESTNLMKTKALKDIEDLMSGMITYYIAAPIMDAESSLPIPLVHFKSGFTKPSRPPAWKGFDLKVESTLPLLGIDQSKLDNNPLSFSAEDYGKTWKLVKVHLQLDDA